MSQGEIDGHLEANIYDSQSYPASVLEAKLVE